MDDLQMQFAEPEWQPPKQRSSPQKQQLESPPAANAPPHEQTQWQAPSQTEDEHGLDASYRAQENYDQSGQPQRSRRSFVPWIMGLLIVFVVLGGLLGRDGIFFFEIGWLRSLLLLVVIVAVIGVVITMFSGRKRLVFANQKTVETRTFPVGMQTVLDIKDEFGSIRVHTGEGETNEIVVQATKQSKGWAANLKNIQISYSQKGDGNTIKVKADSGWSSFGKNSVDFDIT